MPKLSEQKINNIYLCCNSAPMAQLLDYCLDPESGITVDGLRAVHYNKIEQLEKQYYAQAEEIIWAKSQNSIEALTSFIEKCQQGVFSTAHLAQAINKRKELAAELEEKDWNTVMLSNDINALNAFIKKCKEGTYSQAHLKQAIDKAESLDWNTVQYSRDAVTVKTFISKCHSGYYSTMYLQDAEALLGRIENAAVIEDWNNVIAIRDSEAKRRKLLEFMRKYEDNSSTAAQNHMTKANELMEQLADAELSRVDWIDAQNRNTILDYVDFLNKHPYSEYREEAELRIQNMKGNLLNDMMRYPFKYPRGEMYRYISSGSLTMQDLVDKSGVLTDRGYSHIKKYPTLNDEQRDLPVSRLENPHSESGNTDIFFFGVSGSGKTCVLSGLMSLTGQLGFSFDPVGPGGGGHYAMDLRNYARTSMLPPATDQHCIQVIDGQINDEKGNLHKISFIEMSGEKTAIFASMENPTSIEDLGPGAAGLLNNDNDKLLFFVIDPTNEKEIKSTALDEARMVVQQSDVLECIVALLAKNPSLMKKVNAIHIILTKSDTLGDFVDQNVIMDMLNKQGYAAVLSSLKELCVKYDINKQTGFQVGLYPFCVGKFMPGEVYTFDETHSLKLLRAIQRNTGMVRRRTFRDQIVDWFNS